MDGLIGSGKLTQRVKATITKVMQSITEKKGGLGTWARNNWVKSLSRQSSFKSLNILVFLK